MTSLLTVSSMRFPLKSRAQNNFVQAYTKTGKMRKTAQSLANNMKLKDILTNSSCGFLRTQAP